MMRKSCVYIGWPSTNDDRCDETIRFIFFLLTTSAPMRKAGGRLFVDATQQLALPASRDYLINTLGKSDPLVRDALTTIVKRDNFIKLLPDDEKGKSVGKSVPPANSQPEIENDPAIVTNLIQNSQASLEELKQNMQLKSGVDVLDFILEDIQQLKKVLFNPQSIAVIMAGMNASTWINEKMEQWLGEKMQTRFLNPYKIILHLKWV